MPSNPTRSILDVFTALPPEWPEDCRPQIQEMVRQSGRKIVIVDDDPTGCQTIHDLPILMNWDEPTLRQELLQPEQAFFILTNSRSLPLVEAAAVNRELGLNLREAARKTGQPFVVISRSDSTLRGHYPGEVEALAESLGLADEPCLLIPFFLEGQRYTVDDIHYLAEGSSLIPVAETTYARDPYFGYPVSDLKRWVEYKTNGKVPADTVESISIGDIRQGGPEWVAEKLLRLPPGATCVVNAVSRRDLDVLVVGLLNARTAGKRFLYRTAASFVQARIGLTDQSYLTPQNLSLPESGGGLTIVGSYVPTTTQQLTPLLADPQVTHIEVQIDRLLNDQLRPKEIERAVKHANHVLKQSKDIVIYTSRQPVLAETKDVRLAAGAVISQGLVAIVQSISERPRYILAKGGITSNDIARYGLRINRAWVRGQILPGVSVWQAGAESRFPGLAYIVFPGNVGDRTSLVNIVTQLRKV